MLKDGLYEQLINNSLQEEISACDSEKFDIPVLLRMTTRVCHSQGVVNLWKEKEPAPVPTTNTVTQVNREPKNCNLYKKR